MELNKIINGDAYTVLKTLPDNVFSCCITSPPYWGLRDYCVEGQIGFEKTPEQYIEKLNCVFSQVYRVLKNDGTLWLNIADTYLGRGGEKRHLGHKDPKHPNARTGNFIEPQSFPHSFIKPKSLCLIPHRVALALQSSGWIIRSDIIWHKTNPMPESCTDRPTRCYEHLFLCSKNQNYYYNQLLEPYVENSDMKYRKTLRCGRKYGTKRPYIDNQPLSYLNSVDSNQDGKNIRDVWTLNNISSGTEHIATFCPQLVERCLLAGCPPQAIVLDPFIGSGTVARVAIKNNRSFVGIELNNNFIQDIALYKLKSFESGVPEKELKTGQMSLFA